MVTLIPQVLIQVRIRDLLQRLNLVAGHKVGVHVLELNGHLLEGTLREQVALDSRESLVRIVVGLLDQTQLLSLLLVQACLDGVLLLEPLQSQNEQFGVVLVVQWREGDRSELPTLQPVHRGGVDRHGLLSANVGAILQVVVLPLLLGLQPETGQASQILLAGGLVHGRTTADTLSVVVRRVGPPIGLGLDVAKDHVLDRGRQAGDLPRNVGLPASPSL